MRSVPLNATCFLASGNEGVLDPVHVQLDAVIRTDLLACRLRNRDGYDPVRVSRGLVPVGEYLFLCRSDATSRRLEPIRLDPVLGKCQLLKWSSCSGRVSERACQLASPFPLQLIIVALKPVDLKGVNGTCPFCDG